MYGGTGFLKYDPNHVNPATNSACLIAVQFNVNVGPVDTSEYNCPITAPNIAVAKA